MKEFLGTRVSAEAVQRRRESAQSASLPDLPTAALPADFDWHGGH